MAFLNDHCVACGKPIRLIDNDHHCSPEFERRRQAIDRREQEHRGRHVFSLAERLSYGFYLMSLQGK